MNRSGTLVLIVTFCVLNGSLVLGEGRSVGSSPQGIIEDEYLDANWAWNHGILGTNVRVAIGSTGVDKGSTTDIHPDLAGRIAQLIDYTESDTSDGVAEDEYGGTMGTYSAGLVAGTGVNNSDAGKGMAPDSKIVVQRLFDKNGNFINPGYQKLFKDASVNQAAIFKADFSYQAGGNYTDPSSQFDRATRDANPDQAGDQPLLCVVGAGIVGPQNNTIREPGVAKNVLTVGGMGNPRKGTEKQIMSWSSRGPTNDGRLKPDVVAPGDSVYGVKGRLFPPPPYQNLSGGISATGLAAGATALVYHYYVKAYSIVPSPALVKASIINSAEDVNDGIPIPNNGEGWGRIKLSNIIYPSHHVLYANQNITLATGENVTFYIRPDTLAAPLKITLVWTDPEAPNTTNGSRALINDLQLDVYAPDGKRYVGNQFAGGWSVPNPAGNDSLNNVENVYLPASLINNSYKVVITAKWVGVDARKDTGPVDQDFALVISNARFSVPPDTEPPVAKAPSPQNVPVGTVVTLDGSNSTDNVGITNYTWTFDDSGPQTLYGKVTQYKFDHVGNFEVTLTVKDAAGNSDSDTTWVNVTSSVKPLARVDVIPSSITLKVGDVFVFVAKAYDSDNTEISATFTWSVTGNIGTIQTNGSFTATSAGTGKVSATSTVGNVTKSGYANVTVISKPPSGLGVVSGVVKDEDSIPIPNARVTLEFSNSTVANVTTSNAQGYYSITRNPGSYFIYAEKTGYIPSQKKAITITDGNITTFDITLKRSVVSEGTVQGKVVDQEGKPIAGAKVMLLFSGNRTLANYTTSGTSGEYSLRSHPGTYILYAEAQGCKSDEQTVTLTAGGVITRNIMVNVQAQPEEGINPMYIALLVILIVVVILVIALIAMKKRKKPVPETPKGGEPKPSSPTRTERLTLVYDEVCNDCQDAIKSGNDAIKCRCGKYYHIQCASSISVCPKCGTDLLSGQGSAPASPPAPPPSGGLSEVSSSVQASQPPSGPPPPTQAADHRASGTGETPQPTQKTQPPPPAAQTRQVSPPQPESKSQPSPQSHPQSKGAKPEKKALEEQFIRDLGIASKKKRTIEDLFLLYRDGRLIKHKTTELKPMDADILSSMLMAVQEFVKDAFKSGTMNEMGYDGKKIYFAQGTYLTLAIVADASAEIPGLHEKMKGLLVEIEREYGTHLISWDGNVGALKFTDEYLTKLIADLTSK